jgi:pantoate--beta-alanine ligase
VVGWPTVRENDGLALSSRNMYLSDRDRVAALSLNQALQAGAAAGRGGPRAVLDAAGRVLAAEPGIAVDYLALVDEQRWTDADNDTARARLLVAARVGTTRLIDNVSIDLGTLVG